MNESMGKKLLNKLLDKYERSSFFHSGVIPSKRIMLKLYDQGKNEFPAYNIENSEQRMAINDWVRKLAEKDLIYFEWMKGEEDHILAKIWLNFEHLPEVYRFAGRVPQNDLLNKLETELMECRQSLHSQWMKDYLQDSCQYLRQKRRLSTLIPENAKERNSLLQALRYLDANGGKELLKRIFSIRCFGGSKYFEQVIEAHLLRILKKYLDYDGLMTNEQLLNQIGIVKYPEQIEFCGSIKLGFPDGSQLDFSSLRGGSAVYGQDADLAQVNLGVSRILSIENKANYFDYIAKHRQADELVLYHGGQYSSAKGRFWLSIVKASEHIPWYHWSDIDYGGFRMLARLRREINPEIQAYRMNKQELISFSSFTTSFSAEYAQKLQKLLACMELSDCSECLEYMLKHKIRLEQEALLE